jgi:hypothetical protein
MMVLQNRMGLLRGEHGSCSMTCRTSSDNVHEDLNMKVEGTGIEAEEISLPHTVKVEQNEVSYMSLYPLLDALHTLPLSRNSCCICKLNISVSPLKSILLW